MTNSIIAQIKDLETQRQELLDAAREEALLQANDAIETLNELGFSYRIVAKKGKRIVRTTRQKRQPSNQEEHSPDNSNTPYPTDATSADVA